MEFWTADFNEYKKKVESSFGDIDTLANEYPDIYLHQVLSSGFTEFAGVTNLFARVKEEVAGSEKAFHQVVNGPDSEQKKRYNEEYGKKLKEEYLKWARVNALGEELLEEGWKVYLED